MAKRSAGRAVAADFSIDDGRALAAQMLHELEAMNDAGTVYDCWIGQEYRAEGSQQDNVVARYLSSIRHTGSLSLEMGFTEVLSDFIACVINGSTPAAACYENCASD